MRLYGLAARAFITAICILGLGVSIAAFLFPPTVDLLTPIGVGFAMALALAAGSRKLDLIRSNQPGEVASISLGFVVTFLSVVTFGYRAGILVGVSSALGATLFPKRQSLHQILFNASEIALVACISHLTFVKCKNIVPAPFEFYASTLIAALAYFLCNSLLVSIVLSLTSGQSAYTIWRKNFMWSGPSHLAVAACIALGLRFYDLSAQPWPQIAGLLLIALPLLAFTYQAYKLYVENVEHQRRYIEELHAGRHRMQELYHSTVRSLATAVAARDQFTHHHIRRVQHYALNLALRLGLDGKELEAVRIGALLHDIGKLGVPDYILLKPGTLSAEEFDRMKRHAEVGAAILEPVGFPGPVVEIVRHHHEHWDGNGYPAGIAGDAVPIGARIMSVVDVFDAMTSDRPYRAAMSEEQALDFIRLSPDGSSIRLWSMRF